jgi:hypothetical protein
MSKQARTNLLWAVVFGLFAFTGTFAATQYGNVLLLDNIAFASLPAAGTANQGGAAYDTTNDVLRISTTTGVGSEWVNQWQQGVRVGSKAITENSTDAIAAVGFQFTSANAFTAAGARTFAVSISGGATWSSDDIAVVETENYYTFELPSFGVAIVTTLTEYRAPLFTGTTHQLNSLDFAGVTVSVAGTGVGDFTIVSNHTGGACTFTWPCALAIDTPTTVAGSGACSVAPDSNQQIIVDVTACTTPPTLYPTPTVTYRIRSQR